eukprot:8591601-Alexandrium_andersonii.AAC.1
MTTWPRLHLCAPAATPTAFAVLPLLILPPQHCRWSPAIADPLRPCPSRLATGPGDVGVLRWPMGTG